MSKSKVESVSQGQPEGRAEEGGDIQEGGRNITEGRESQTDSCFFLKSAAREKPLRFYLALIPLLSTRSSGARVAGRPVLRTLA
jgi:hypothetical protein